MAEKSGHVNFLTNLKSVQLGPELSPIHIYCLHLRGLWHLPNIGINYKFCQQMYVGTLNKPLYWRWGAFKDSIVSSIVLLLSTPLSFDSPLVVQRRRNVLLEIRSHRTYLWSTLIVSRIEMCSNSTI